uniref:voltage-gated purine nucleotide uniporter SLC17A9-like n=1 Tax=Panthera onca TaxID=9690 RepID=UPI002954A461
SRACLSSARVPPRADHPHGTVPLPAAQHRLPRPPLLGTHSFSCGAFGDPLPCSYPGVGGAATLPSWVTPSLLSHRPECQAWTGTLLLGTGLLYCARVSVPVCAVSMSQDFGWNKKEAGVVLSSFFWGYCLTQVVGGHLGDRIGGEKVILLSASAWGFITAATPLLARLSSAHLVLMTFSRILTGLLQGVYFPALTSLLSQKVRESERAFTYSAVGAGSQFG